jgi:hypothetical protein
MTQPDSLEVRVAALESQMLDVTKRLRASERDAAAARVLAGGADREVGEVRDELRDFRRATTASFNALREELVDRLARIDKQFERVDMGFADMRGKFDASAAGQEHIVQLLQTLIDRGEPA